jgi:hypothetical protein
MFNECRKSIFMLQGCFVQRVASHLFSFWRIFFGNKISFQTNVFLDVAITYYFLQILQTGGVMTKKSIYSEPTDTNSILSMKCLNRSGSWNSNLQVWNSCTRLFPCVWGWPSNHLNYIADTLLTPCDELNDF